MTANDVQIEVANVQFLQQSSGKCAVTGGGHKKSDNETAIPADKKPPTPPRPVVEEEEEDGDIATPKIDRDGDDDQSL